METAPDTVISRRTLTLVFLLIALILVASSSACSTSGDNEPSSDASPDADQLVATAETIVSRSPEVLAIEEFASDVNEFNSMVQDLENDYADVVEIFYSSFVSEDWKSKLSSLLEREQELMDAWLAIEVPAPFLGFHETITRGLAISSKTSEHYILWLNSFNRNSQDVQAPWDHGASLGIDRISIFESAEGALSHGLSVYAAQTNNSDLTMEFEAVMHYGDLFAEQYALSLIPKVKPTATPRTYPTSVTLALFNSLRMGMSHRQVQNIVGISCNLISESGGLGKEFDTAMYQCDGSGLLGANMNYMIQGGKLISKAQFGLR